MASLTGQVTLQTSADEVIECRAFLLQCEYPLLAQSGHEGPLNKSRFAPLARSSDGAPAFRSEC